ncbi:MULTISPECIES: LysR family transcriptional regulator [unclassified Arthrobacter]|jgi:DNA-binding transcriptional LysR family regulator|uniref:LysR family transcriptional regulator n=1 Tax=unclassified Arthrobacter TaxID=235627 RepID=UPI00035C5A31|nr:MULTISPECIES: LysR family transcriptional regulator [unclassified Arthrobacter]BCW54376.1 transcriptional regulator [Arthrobacter sp. StoSoilB19]
MELRQLRYFVAVFNQKSISRAAEQLLISQPALTRQIRLLEHECGTPLFERLPKGTFPTPAGAALHKHALTMLAMAGSAREVARQAGPVKQPVAVGLAPGLPFEWVDRLLAAVAAQAPLAELELTDGDTTNQLRMVREGRLDIGLVHQEPSQDLVGGHVRKEFFGLACRPGLPAIGDETSCRLADVHDQPVLIHSREQFPLGHDRLLATSHEMGVAPAWRIATFNEHARACADSTSSVAVMLTEASASRLLPDWPWKQLVDPAMALETWLVRQPVTRGIVEEVAGVILATFQ